MAKHHQLNLALILTTLFALAEFAGGWIADSLALLADAVHMTSDVIALSIAAFANQLAQRPANHRMTYGYGRARLLAAQVNGAGLWFLSGWIAWEAFGRLLHPPQVQGWIVVVIGFMGLVINLVVLKWLHGGHDINTRAAFWHVLGDTLGSVAAVISGFVIITTGWMPIDPILSFLIAAILAWGGWRLLSETTHELMAATPFGIDVQSLKNDMSNVDGVTDIHHLHLWKLPDGGQAISAHVVVKNLLQWDRILVSLQQILYHAEIEHTALQPESDLTNCNHHCCDPCDH